MYFAAAAFYLAAGMNFWTGGSTSAAVVWLCLGSSFLCFAAAYANKGKKPQEEEPPRTEKDHLPK